MPDGAQKPEAKPMRKRLTADEVSPRSVFLDVPNMPWETTKFAGIKCKTLYSDGSGTSAPGSSSISSVAMPEPSV